MSKVGQRVLAAHVDIREDQSRPTGVLACYSASRTTRIRVLAERSIRDRGFKQLKEVRLTLSRGDLRQCHDCVNRATSSRISIRPRIARRTWAWEGQSKTFLDVCSRSS